MMYPDCARQKKSVGFALLFKDETIPLKKGLNKNNYKRFDSINEID